MADIRRQSQSMSSRNSMNYTDCCGHSGCFQRFLGNFANSDSILDLVYSKTCRIASTVQVGVSMDQALSMERRPDKVEKAYTGLGGPSIVGNECGREPTLILRAERFVLILLALIKAHPAPVQWIWLKLEASYEAQLHPFIRDLYRTAFVLQPIFVRFVCIHSFSSSSFPSFFATVSVFSLFRTTYLALLFILFDFLSVEKAACRFRILYPLASCHAHWDCN